MVESLALRGELVRNCGRSATAPTCRKISCFAPHHTSKTKMNLKVHGLITFWALLTVATALAAADRELQPFVQKHCVECHDTETKKGDLDLTALKLDLTNPTNFSQWVLVHDRVDAGEMPPKKKARPESAELGSFLKSLSSSLVGAEQARIAKEGRATQRRLNRYEYENALRDLLHAPWLQVKDSL